MAGLAHIQLPSSMQDVERSSNSVTSRRTCGLAVTQGSPAMKKKMMHRVYVIRHVHQGKWLPLFLSTARSAKCRQVLTTTPCRFSPFCSSAGRVFSCHLCSVLHRSMLCSTVLHRTRNLHTAGMHHQPASIFWQFGLQQSEL